MREIQERIYQQGLQHKTSQQQEHRKIEELQLQISGLKHLVTSQQATLEKENVNPFLNN